MKSAEEVRAEHKLDAITHYLLKTFPGAELVSAGEGETYRLTISAATLQRALTLHIASTFLKEAHPTVDEIPVLFDQLDLSTRLRERGQYALGDAGSFSRRPTR